MISPGWISAIIALLGIIIAIGGSWKLTQYRLGKIEERQARADKNLETFTEAIISLKNIIREEFEQAIARINKLLFEDGGTSRYLPRSEFDRTREGCRSDIVRRIERLEGRAHDHHPH